MVMKNFITKPDWFITKPDWFITKPDPFITKPEELLPNLRGVVAWAYYFLLGHPPALLVPSESPNYYQT